MNLLKTVATVSGFTLLSRVTGLIREVITAGLFGASAATDAFFVAFRLPNLLRRLFAEGAFSQAFVPVLGQTKARDGEAVALALAHQVALLLFLALGVITLMGITVAPILVLLMTGGYGGDLPREQLTIDMTRWMFPYIWMIGLVALASGVLNTWSRFKLPAFTPVLLNLSFIGCALVLAPQLDEPIWALVAAVLIGGMLQLGVQAYGLHRAGLLRGLPALLRQPLSSTRAALASEPVRRILTLMLPASLAVSVAQVSLVINTHIAARLEAGSVSWLSYADRLMEFPTAMLGVALGTVLLPTLSKAFGTQDIERAHALVDWGLRLVLLLAVPASVGLWVLSEPLAASLFHYGAFDAQDLAMTAWAMQSYAFGLLGLIAVKVLAPGFYAQQNVRTPVKIALVSLVVTQLLNVITVPFLAHAGLALSTSLAAWVNAGLLLTFLIRKSGFRLHPGWMLLGLRVLVSAAVMGALLAWLALPIPWAAWQSTPFTRVGALSGLLVLALTSYGLCLTLLGVRWRSLLKGPLA
jgi:putative peptidoglycan lipid II flippase